MTPMLELTLADGRELDIPSGSVIMFEGMNEGANPNFPSAKSFIRYGMGSEVRNGVLSTKVEDLVFELGINTSAPSKWLRLTKKTGEALVLLSGNVVGRMSLEEGCEVSYVVGDVVEVAQVTQSRREIKKWSEREVGRPEGLIEMPVPEDNR